MRNLRKARISNVCCFRRIRLCSSVNRCADCFRRVIFLAYIRRVCEGDVIDKVTDGIDKVGAAKWLLSGCSGLEMVVKWLLGLEMVVRCC